MPSKTLYKYRYYSTDDSTFHTEWLENKPTGSHIDPLSITIIDQVSQELIQIQNDYNKTGGNYMLEGWNVQVPAQSNYNTSKIYPFGISCYNVYCFPTESNIGDTFSAYCPLPTVPVTLPVQVGSSNIAVPSAFTSAVNVGFYLSLKSSNATEDLGRVIYVNQVNNIVTTEYAASNAYSYPNDQISIKAYFVKDFHFPILHKYIVGEGTLNGTYIPPETPVFLEYKNNNCVEKKMAFQVEYMY